MSTTVAHNDSLASADPIPQHAKEHFRGSFLLTNNKSGSDAAKVIKSTKGPVTEDKNEAVGRKLIAQREKQMGPNVSVFYKDDGGLVVTKGEGSYMIDIDGNRHLDCCNNVACVGHSHPRVVAAGQAELASIQTNGRFLHPTRQRYLEKLLETFPPELNTIYLVNSGSEANDLALRIAREHTTAKCPKDVIVLDSAYHGHTQSLVDISPYKWYQATDGEIITLYTFCVPMY
jgi:ethanolamine-phosphate phospho-lyase